MSLKLYQINTTLNHPDCMAGLKKMMDDEIFSFFILDIGNEEKIKRRKNGNRYRKSNNGYNPEVAQKQIKNKYSQNCSGNSQIYNRVDIVTHRFCDIHIHLNTDTFRL